MVTALLLCSVSGFSQRSSSPYIYKISGSECFAIAHVVSFLGEHDLYLIENDFTRNPYETELDPYTLTRYNHTWHLKPVMVKRNGVEQRYFTIYNLTNGNYLMMGGTAFTSSSMVDRAIKRKPNGELENVSAAKDVLFNIVPRGDGTVSITDFNNTPISARGRGGRQSVSRFLLILVD